MDGRPEGGFVEVQHFAWWVPAVMLGTAALVLGLWVAGAGTRPIPGWVATVIAAFLAGLVLLLLRMRFPARSRSERGPLPSGTRRRRRGRRRRLRALR